MATATVVSGDFIESDQQLVERHRYGDGTAFDEIYSRFGSMVYNLALRMAGDESEAADCTQETFLRVYRHLAGFRGKSSLKTWVFRVAVNCCRSRLRRQATRRKVVETWQNESLERVADQARDPEQSAAAAEVSELVRRALLRVPLVYREAVILRDLNGLSYAEVAAVLGIRVGTVRSRIARGREHMRTLLESD